MSKILAVAFIALIVYSCSSSEPPRKEDIKAVLEKHYNETISSAKRDLEGLSILSQIRVTDEKGVFRVVAAAWGVIHYLPAGDSTAVKTDEQFRDTVSMSVSKGPIGWVWVSYDK